MTYTLTHDGIETVYNKRTGYPSNMLEERKVGNTIKNGTIYLLDLPKVKAKSAYFKPKRRIWIIVIFNDYYFFVLYTC